MFDYAEAGRGIGAAKTIQSIPIPNWSTFAVRKHTGRCAAGHPVATFTDNLLSQPNIL
jgi:hypothetical protein